MEFVCEICQKTFKSNAGLQGHRQLAHQVVMKRELPSNETLAINLEAALDEVGRLQENFSETLGSIMKALQVIQEQQRGLAGTLHHNAIKPNAALLEHWGSCADCEKELVLLRSQLAGLLPAPTPPPADPMRWRKENNYPWEETTETTDPAVAQQWREAGADVVEVNSTAPTPPAAETETKYPWDDKKD